MADLTFRSNTTGGDSTLSVSSIVATLPTGTTSGDLMTIWCSTGVVAPATPPDFQTPTGWTLAGSSGSIAVASGALNAKGFLFYKIAGGGESNVTLSTVGGTNAAMTFSRSSRSNPKLSAPLAQISWIGGTGGPGTSVVVTGLTTGADRALIEVFLAQGTAQSATPPGSMTERSDFAANGISTADELIPLAGATGTRTFTLPVSADYIWGIAEFRSSIYANAIADLAAPETVNPTRANPFDISAWFAPTSVNRWFWKDWFLAGTSSGVTGTLATTNANDTLAASGTTTIVGALAKTNANDTSAASGTTTIVGTLAKTNANDSVSASGTTTVVGALATTNANDTLSASGSVGSAVSGTLAYTNLNDTSAASGTTVIVGVLAATNNNDTLAASGNAGTPTATKHFRLLRGVGT